MQEEYKQVNLREILESYLDTPGYNNFPEIDLLILDNEQLMDFFNNSIRTIKLTDKIKQIFEAHTGDDEDDVDCYNLNRFAGSVIRLHDWSLKCVSISQKHTVVDFYCKKMR